MPRVLTYCTLLKAPHNKLTYPPHCGQASTRIQRHYSRDMQCPLECSAVPPKRAARMMRSKKFWRQRATQRTNLCYELCGLGICSLCRRYVWSFPLTLDEVLRGNELDLRRERHPNSPTRSPRNGRRAPGPSSAGPGDVDPSRFPASSISSSKETPLRIRNSHCFASFRQIFQIAERLMIA